MLTIACTQAAYLEEKRKFKSPFEWTQTVKALAIAKVLLVVSIWLTLSRLITTTSVDNMSLTYHHMASKGVDCFSLIVLY